MVVFVGSNPAQLSPDPLTAFAGTKSGKRLALWIAEIGVVGADVINVSSIVTPGNRPLKVSEFDLESLRRNLSRDPMGYRRAVVALGKTASLALRKIGMDHFVLPHPSGRNRQLNDSTYVEAQLALCREYIEHRLGRRTEPR
jgi:uracil-DNA glycosylase